MRNQSLLEDDDELYEEYDKQLRDTEKFLVKAQNKLDETSNQWGAEKTKHEAREAADLKKQIQEQFDQNKETREAAMAVPK
jgi:phage-related tail protein